MTLARQIFGRRDYGAIDAFLGAGILVVAVFAWVANSVDVTDPIGELTDNWKWQVWQIGPLVFSLIGVWLLWRNTSKVPWVRTVCLVSLALAILLNAYTDVFNYSDNLKYTMAPLLFACGTVAAATGWRQLIFQRKGSGQTNPLTLLFATLNTGLIVALFDFFYIVASDTDPGNTDALDILYPLAIAAVLLWAIFARRINVGDATTSPSAFSPPSY